MRSDAREGYTWRSHRYSPLPLLSIKGYYIRLRHLPGLSTKAAAIQGAQVPDYVAQHREAMWLVGPFFASITGLGIKEGLCYGTGAAIGITLVTPILCLGHLTGLMPEAGTQALLVALNLLAVVFAAGKYGQPLKGDIGDKSIFEVMALPKEEQQKKWAALEQSRAGGNPPS